jgi:hypothetical protein
MKQPKESTNGKNPAGIIYSSRNQTQDSSTFMFKIFAVNLLFTRLIGFWRMLLFGSFLGSLY